MLYRRRWRIPLSRPGPNRWDTSTLGVPPPAVPVEPVPEVPDVLLDVPLLALLDDAATPDVEGLVGRVGGLGRLQRCLIAGQLVLVRSELLLGGEGPMRAWFCACCRGGRCRPGRERASVWAPASDALAD